MIAEGEGGLLDAQYRTGMTIGLVVAAVMGAVVVHLVMRRRSETGVLIGQFAFAAVSGWLPRSQTASDLAGDDESKEDQ